MSEISSLSRNAFIREFREGLKVLIANEGEPRMGAGGLGLLDPAMNALLHRIRSHGSTETQARAAHQLMARIGSESLANPKTAKNYPLMVHATNLMGSGEVAVRAHDYGKGEFEKAFSMMPNYIDAGQVPNVSRVFDHIIASSVQIRTQRMIRGEDTVVQATRLGQLTGAAASGVERLHQRSQQAQQMLAHIFDVQLSVVTAMTGQVAKSFLDAPQKGLYEAGRTLSPTRSQTAPTTTGSLLDETANLLDAAIASDAVGPVYYRADGTADLSAHPDLDLLQSNADTYYRRAYNEAAAKYL